jgi:hypothetical protein
MEPGSKGSQGTPPHVLPHTGDIRRSWWNPAGPVREASNGLLFPPGKDPEVEELVVWGRLQRKIRDSSLMLPLRSSSLVPDVQWTFLFPDEKSA